MRFLFLLSILILNQEMILSAQHRQKQITLDSANNM